MRVIAVLCSLLCPWPGALLADGSGSGLSLSGTVTGGFSSEIDGTGIGRFDLTLGVTSRHAIGLEVGLYSFLRNGSHPHETYGALTLGEHLRVGVVRPAHDSVLTSPFALVAPAVEDATLPASRAYATEKAMQRTAVPVGLSWTGETAGTRWSASAHDARKGGFRALSLAAERSFDAWTLAAAVEAVTTRDGGDRIGTNAKLGLGLHTERLDAGLTLLAPRANRVPDAVEMDVTVAVTPALRLGALAHLEHRRSGSHVGLSAEYGLGRSDTLAVTVGDRGAVHAGLTHRF